MLVNQTSSPRRLGVFCDMNKKFSEADIEWVCIVDLLDVFACQLERQSGDVAIQVRLLAASDDREDVGSLVEHISESNPMSVK